MHRGPYGLKRILVCLLLLTVIFVGKSAGAGPDYRHLHEAARQAYGLVPDADFCNFVEQLNGEIAGFPEEAALRRMRVLAFRWLGRTPLRDDMETLARLLPQSATDQTALCMFVESQDGEEAAHACYTRVVSLYESRPRQSYEEPDYIRALMLARDVRAVTARETWLNSLPAEKQAQWSGLRHFDRAKVIQSHFAPLPDRDPCTHRHGHRP